MNTWELFPSSETMKPYSYNEVLSFESILAYFSSKSPVVKLYHLNQESISIFYIVILKYGRKSPEPMVYENSLNTYTNSISRKFCNMQVDNNNTLESDVSSIR